MTILITGITGMVGSHLLDFLIKKLMKNNRYFKRRSPLNIFPTYSLINKKKIIFSTAISEIV